MAALSSEDIPLLKLSAAEKIAIAAEAQAILNETLRVEHLFVSESASVDQRKWKEVRSKDDFRIYKQRRTRSSSASVDLAARREDSISSDGIQAPRFVSIYDDRGVSGTWTTTSSEEEGIVASIKSPRVPMIVACGNVEGTLEDALFGCLAGDEISWRLRSAYMKDNFAHAKILATIQGPINEDPFRHLGIKWFMQGRQTIVPTSWIHDRDFLVMEATGITIDQYGVPHGYYLLHEFHHPHVPERMDLKIVRGKLSLCYISRQVSPGKVHVFARGFVDPRGDLINSLTIVLAAEAMISTAKTVDASYAKKIAYLMARERRLRKLKSQYDFPVTPVKTCGACDKASGLLRGAFASCQICARNFCSRCTVQWNIVMDVHEDGVTERLLSFCFGCLLTAKQLSPREVALDTIARSQVVRTVGS
ncbi:hypothetical protein Poli38472_012583 [Pythium oligandrum]|uniref:FYVE-type domain-containing protein n=1 Tax=Pythium oligandrum TaxID=41045 RepID=A0A8K1CFU7_PYTOL|nr:hypothetical protein Poli38472_012583 [Pythium oligandrum]|eukprot:TMW61392.1 hypothetical protein Poli38472_012583 [Pythium oligandrum]